MHFAQFSLFKLYVALQRWLNRVKCIVYKDLNNRRTGKDSTKPRALGLLGHSELYYLQTAPVKDVIILRKMLFTVQSTQKYINYAQYWGFIPLHDCERLSRSSHFSNIKVASTSGLKCVYSLINYV